MQKTKFSPSKNPLPNPPKSPLFSPHKKTTFITTKDKKNPHLKAGIFNSENSCYFVSVTTSVFSAVAVSAAGVSVASGAAS